MTNQKMANAYKTQQVMTASPEQLTLLLYNGALRFLNESIQSMQQGCCLAAWIECFRLEIVGLRYRGVGLVVLAMLSSLVGFYRRSPFVDSSCYIITSLSLIHISEPTRLGMIS